MKLQVERDLVQSTVNYLKTRPFEEVHTLIGALLQCKEIVEPEIKTEDEHDQHNEG